MTGEFILLINVLFSRCLEKSLSSAWTLSLKLYYNIYNYNSDLFYTSVIILFSTALVFIENNWVVISFTLFCFMLWLLLYTLFSLYDTWLYLSPIYQKAIYFGKNRQTDEKCWLFLSTAQVVKIYLLLHLKIV